MPTKPYKFFDRPEKLLIIFIFFVPLILGLVIFSVILSATSRLPRAYTPSCGHGVDTNKFDINHNGIINSTDLNFIRKATEPGAAYNSAYDFNNDGVVNDADLNLASTYFGAVCTVNASSGTPTPTSSPTPTPADNNNNNNNNNQPTPTPTPATTSTGGSSGTGGTTTTKKTLPLKYYGNSGLAPVETPIGHPTDQVGTPPSEDNASTYNPNGELAQLPPNSSPAEDVSLNSSAQSSVIWFWVIFLIGILLVSAFIIFIILKRKKSDKEVSAYDDHGVNGL